VVSFSEKSEKYLKENIKETETNSKNKNVTDLRRAINEFNKGCQPRKICKR